MIHRTILSLNGYIVIAFKFIFIFLLYFLSAVITLLFFLSLSEY